MIHFFHGFLGSPSDFDFLPKRPDINCHHISSRPPEIGPEDTLVGYSMGGRLAMEIAARVNFKIKKLILLNAHPGLSNDEIKKDRAIWEDETLARMDSENFLAYWNSLPIFKYDRPLPEISEEQLAIAKKSFDAMRLSKQENYLPLLQEHKEKVLWVIGSLDEKYRALADRDLLPRGFKCRFVETGHRLFQRPELVLGVLKEEGVL